MRVNVEGEISLAENKPTLSKHDAQAFKQIANYIIETGAEHYVMPIGRSKALHDAVQQFEKAHAFLSKDGGLSQQDMTVLDKVSSQINAQIQHSQNAQANASRIDLTVEMAP